MLDLTIIQKFYKKYRMLDYDVLFVDRKESTEEWWNKIKDHLSTTHNRADVMVNPEGTCDGDGQENDDD